MPKTGERCDRSGKYSGTCEQRQHRESAGFTSGDTFTPCSTCGGLGKQPGAVMNWTWTSS